ncbi:uncharacterized protein MONBRDRAFT_25258 [Monosiga brevicollis MX1]|uniref:Guanosine-3',5'-bis(diphosphate) 3'-pyrophosphohydrolase MESH1 n=1 Tax=Monosiga brevicollis TaxID=81824 RepID=A9UYV8_MONBE|nr:uncharacterized protein MONBRDRAFT_25258 [Monosiga brevicollis MX1]EDQ89674.1 predicted protein [Monosiga brevicollis MX1]|eukprot:XP_001745703.1 hypothetical protein [Monosiga brevicollis MX1]
MAEEGSALGLAGGLLKAAAFAGRAHGKQTRKGDGTPYVNHPIQVAEFLTEIAGITDLAILQAALLHDVVEDTSVTLADIRAAFGDQVAGYVQEVSDDKSCTRHERKAAEIEHARTASRGAKLIKLADKLHNLRSVQGTPPASWDQHRAHAYFGFASEILEACRGTNAALEAAFEHELSQDISVQGSAPSPGLRSDYVAGDWRKHTPDA